MVPGKQKIDIIDGDFALMQHREAFIALLDAYLCDDMGEQRRLSKGLYEKIISGFVSTGCGFVLFAEYNGDIVGMAVGFIVFSTFQGKSVINIHDLIVLPQYRKNGVARKLLNSVEAKARRLNCCKVTLEVREDNLKAKELYRSHGFSAGKNPMVFWVKPL